MIGRQQDKEGPTGSWLTMRSDQSECAICVDTRDLAPGRSDVKSFIFEAGNVFSWNFNSSLKFLECQVLLPMGLSLKVHCNCFIHVCEKLKENRYVQAKPSC